MIAAIYARKSTEQHGADETKSVTRQVAHARQYAAAKGWTVGEACIFVDDGISGAEFTNRPGFVRLMASLKPRSPFQFLIMSEESRLGREAIETAYALKQLVTAGVRVFCYLTDSERTIDSPIEKVMLSLQAMSDEMERTKAHHRARDKALQLVRAGYVAGGRVFGYDNVRIDGHTERRINEAEAAIVRRIFDLAAAGVGQKRIAIQLNDDGVRSPRAQRGRPQAWAPSSVHAVLFRELYRGHVVWNQTRKRDRWGQQRQGARPVNEWMRVPAPALRIVSEALWQATHARIAEARAVYRDETKGLRGGRPRIDSKYLLTGLARCTWCGGGLQVRTGNHGTGANRWRVQAYACSSHQNRGAAVCRNDLRVSMAAVDAAVLGSIGEILTPDLIEGIIARRRELLEQPDDTDAAEYARLVHQRADVDLRITNLTESIELGGNLPTLVARLQQAERTRQDLARAIADLGARPEALRLDWRALERQARVRLADWRAVLTRNITEARQLLRELLAGSAIQITPFVERGCRGFRFEGVAQVGGLLEGLALAANQRGKWRPQRDAERLAVHFTATVIKPRRAA